MQRALLGLMVALAGLAIAGCDDSDGTPDASTTCSSQMYAKYGTAGFHQVTLNIVTNIGTVSAMMPSPIGDTFKGLTPTQVADVEDSLEDFLVMAYGGPNNYTGGTMKDVHAGMGITRAQYDAFVSMVVAPALTSAGVSTSDVKDCFAPPITDEAFVADFIEP